MFFLLFLSRFFFCIHFIVFAFHFLFVEGCRSTAESSSSFLTRFISQRTLFFVILIVLSWLSFNLLSSFYLRYMSTSKKSCYFKASFVFVIFDFNVLTTYYKRERALMYSIVFESLCFLHLKTTSNEYNDNTANAKNNGKSAKFPREILSAEVFISWCIRF